MNIGFISTRFAGTDGVSLESAKWAEVLWADQHVSFWYSGRNDREPGVSFCVPEAYFGHPENEWISERIWDCNTRSRQVTRRIRVMADYLKTTLYQFVAYHRIDLLIPQNILAIPMHVPMGIAMTEFLSETQMPAIAHHHDFYWERTRFSVTGVQDYLDMAFPCRLLRVRHVVINQAAEEQLSLRKGVSSLLIPNVFDFDNPPPRKDSYFKDLKVDLGLAQDDIMILQPTRIVPRKGIEHAIKLVGALEDSKYKLVISHDSGDEGHEYKGMLEELAREEKVDIRFVANRVGEVRQQDSDGRKIYTLWDLYAHADLVTYPSLYEGFGNALLEAIYFQVPIIVNRYSIFQQDIEPKGFKFPMMDGFITTDLVKQVHRILEDSDYRNWMTNHNYEIARSYFSYSILRRNLQTLITSLTGHSNIECYGSTNSDRQAV